MVRVTPADIASCRIISKTSLLGVLFISNPSGSRYSRETRVEAKRGGRKGTNEATART
jgi:hypothetical protein